MRFYLTSTSTDEYTFQTDGAWMSLSSAYMNTYRSEGDPLPYVYCGVAGALCDSLLEYAMLWLDRCGFDHYFTVKIDRNPDFEMAPVGLTYYVDIPDRKQAQRFREKFILVVQSNRFRVEITDTDPSATPKLDIDA